MKLFSWNVNGIRAVINKGEFAKFIDTYDPDILCLQETKATRDQVEIDLPNYHEHFYSAAKTGYSGTAIFSKIPPLNWRDGFPPNIIERFDLTGDEYGNPADEGRIITAEFDDFWVVNCYTPNSKGDLSRLDLRYKKWDKAVLAYLEELLQKEGLLLTQAKVLADFAKDDVQALDLAKDNKILDLITTVERFTQSLLSNQDLLYLDVAKLAVQCSEKSEQEMVWAFLTYQMGKDIQNPQARRWLDLVYEARKMWLANVSFQNVMEYMVLS